MSHPKLSAKRIPFETHRSMDDMDVVHAHGEIARGVRLLTRLFPAGVFSELDLRIHIDLSSRCIAYEDQAGNRVVQTLTLLEADLRRSSVEILTLLLHQMVHAADFARGVEDLYPSGFHNSQFQLSAEEVGFIVKVIEPRRGRVTITPGTELLRYLRDIRLDTSALVPLAKSGAPAPQTPWQCRWTPPPVDWMLPFHLLRLHQPESGPAPPWPVVNKKKGKVHYMWRDEEIIPRLRLTGKWLHQLGFHVGTPVEIKSAPGYIFLRALGTPAQRAGSAQEPIRGAL